MQQTVFASDAFNFGTHDSCNNFDCNFTNENFTGKNISANEFEQKGVRLDHNYVFDDGQGLSGGTHHLAGEDYGDGENASSMNHNYVLVDGQGLSGGIHHLAGEDYGDEENASSMNQGSNGANIDNNYCVGGRLLEPGGKR